ncbi:MAG: HAD family hydrolase [Clostridia bacterium]|nr:HAD family hydrolase [Clostridia bacterium]
MTTKFCIFDLDGTLINSLYDLADAMNYALKKNHLPTHEREKYRFMVGNGISVLADRAMVVPEGTDSELKQQILTEFNSYYNSHNTDLTVPYDGIPELLTQLDELGIQYAVLSNKPDEFAPRIVKTLFPQHHFAAVWGKRDNFPRKPDPTSVLALIHASGFDPEDCLYIGDSDVDIKTARNARLRNVGVSWGFRPVTELQAAGANFIANKPDQIINYL